MLSGKIWLKLLQIKKISTVDIFSQDIYEFRFISFHNSNNTPTDTDTISSVDYKNAAGRLTKKYYFILTVAF